tara:strand:+ start:792 stop:1427 length:636 start_codon:yes stop_codon:yes gene_type:complete
MILDKNIALETATFLLQINAIKLNSKKPFKWASGWRSPIYCDNRLALSFPKVRTFIVNEIANQVRSLYGAKISIAGVATGAIGVGALVANQLNAPFLYVRPEPKKHGRKNQIEGLSPKDKKIVVIEDLISTGMSSLNAVKALKDEGAKVLGMFAIFNYGFEIAKSNFESISLTLNSLSDYENLINAAEILNHIQFQEIETLKSWRENPADW